jgi:large subunit ribosomal protein L10
VTRQEKEEEIESLRERFARATVMLVAESRGLNVAKSRLLRRAIRDAGGEYRVAKNSLAQRAINSTDFAPLGEKLTGPTGLIFGYSDPVAVAKALVKFAEENEKLSVKAAFVDRELLDASAVEELAKLPSREALLGMLLGLLQAPAGQLLRTLQEPSARLARLVGKLRDKREISQ